MYIRNSDGTYIDQGEKRVQPNRLFCRVMTEPHPREVVKNVNPPRFCTLSATIVQRDGHWCTYYGSARDCLAPQIYSEPKNPSINRLWLKRSQFAKRKFEKMYYSVSMCL